MRIRINESSLDNYFRSSGNTCVDLTADPSAIRESRTKIGLVVKRYGNRTYVTTEEMFNYEKSIAKAIVQKVHQKSLFRFVDREEVEKYLAAYEKMEGIRLKCEFHLAPEQKDGVFMAINSNFCVLTGGPGTGKTTVLRAMQFVMENTLKEASREFQILFTAPTGKAARRITESVGVEAKTVQKQMHYKGSEDPEVAPVLGDVLLLDESSMLDVETAEAIFRATKNNIKLIFVGDVDQLPSVGPGAVLRDLIDSLVVPCVKLAAPQRQGADSNIFLNISTIKNGVLYFSEGDDFEVIDASDSTGRDLFIRKYLENVAIYGVDNVVGLTPYRRKGATCANVINDIIQSIVNPPSQTDHINAVITELDDENDIPTKRDITFCLGDPVMQLVNRDECANGDVGKVVLVTKNTVSVNYGDDNVVIYHRCDMDQLNLAYAMSVHKSQGSEYKCVITLALPEHQQLLSRNLLYTAVTRAKMKCVLICDKDTVKVGLTRESGYERFTLLTQLLQEEEEKFQMLWLAYNMA